MTAQAPADPAVDGGFGLYIHWPFCRSKCPYCDFNSHVRERIDQRRWTQALIAELDFYAHETAGRELTSIFFGGGTPSLMETATVAALITRARQHWRFRSDIEITLEANPTSVEAARFAELASAGVNRVSLGIQALDDRDLKFLGRQHDVAEARQAIAIAQRHFARWSFDLIYARPGQSLAGWLRELEEALAMAGRHLSLYQLTIEAGTAFEGAVARGDFRPMAEDAQADLYEATQTRLEAAGLPAYEISNHALPGEESRHNLVYWRYGDYLGIGPGAHGRLTLSGAKLATRQHRAPEIWLERVEAQGHATQAREKVTPDQRLTEFLMMGLRLRQGIARARFQGEFAQAPEALLDPMRLRRLIEGGFLELDQAGLRASPAGRLRLNALLGALLG